MGILDQNLTILFFHLLTLSIFFPGICMAHAWNRAKENMQGMEFPDLLSSFAWSQKLAALSSSCLWDRAPLFANSWVLWTWTAGSLPILTPAVVKAAGKHPSTWYIHVLILWALKNFSKVVWEKDTDTNSNPWIGSLFSWKGFLVVYWRPSSLEIKMNV